jgi:hypothetical protein
MKKLQKEAQLDTATHELELPQLDADRLRPQPPAPEQELQPALELGDRRRLLELAAAVRTHQARVKDQFGSARSHDLALYRRLRQIGGS